MTDFTQFDSRAAADNGAWLHLKNPATGDLMFDDAEPCMVLVRGMESRLAIKASSEVIRKRAPQSALSDIEENHAQNCKAVGALIMDFKNINRGAKPAKVPDDVEWFLGLGIPVGGSDARQMTFVQQVNAFALDRANFLPGDAKA